MRILAGRVISRHGLFQAEDSTGKSYRVGEIDVGSLFLVDECGSYE